LVIGLKGFDVIKIADLTDVKVSFKLLAQMGPIKKLTANQLYLDDKKNGFTILVKNNDNTIAISTFSIRKKKYKNSIVKVLYWENLIVDKNKRDGVAYLEILGYLRKLIKSKEYEDIYFAIRRKKALAIHKAAKFRVIGYISLIFNSIRLQFRQILSEDIEILSYEEFYKHLQNSSSNKIFYLKNFKGFEEVAEHEISRQIYGKNGQVIVDKKNNRIQLVRTIFKSFLLQVNLILQDDDFDLSKKLKCTKQSLFTINFALVKSLHNKRYFSIHSPLMIYEILSLKKLINISNFQFWEHDAW
tara:strand:+ start:3592 stop:4494 length:903 start_codon:yes stop_codon:yes gene_type:complete